MLIDPPPHAAAAAAALAYRRLGHADAAAYLVLRLQGLRDTPEAFGSSWQEEQGMTTEEVRGRLPEVGEEAAAFGAFSGDALVGTVSVVREQRRKLRHKAMLVGMLVAPAYRGQGVGQRLVQLAVAEAARWPGLQRLLLVVNAQNAPAVRLYQSAGFVTYGREEAALNVDGHLHDEWLMSLRLADVNAKGGPSTAA